MEDIIYIQDLIKFYLKNSLIIILITISFFIIGTQIKEDKTPSYEESTTIMLGNLDEDDSMSSSDLSFYSSLLDNYLLLLDSKKLATNVIANLGLDMSASELLNDALFHKSTNSQMIIITVTHEDDILAAKIANEFVNELKKQVNYIYKLDNIVVIDTATASGNIIVEKDNTLTIITLVGFVVSSSLIIGIYCLNDNVRLMMHKEKVLGAEILKTAYYKNNPSPFAFNINNEDKLRRIKSIIYKQLKIKNIKTIMITSDGNKNHSNYSVNIATSVASVSKKTLLIDCNICGNLSNRQSEGILELVYLPKEKILSNLKKFIQTKNNLDFLPIGDVKKNKTDLFSTQEFITVLEILKKEYDAIFVEVPDITKSFEGMILADILDCTIVVMKENKITKNKIKQFYDKLDSNKNELIAIAPVKSKL